MLKNTPPNSRFSVNDFYFNILDLLTKRFSGLSPFEILNTPTQEVMDLYVDVAINDHKEKNKNTGDVWLTSKNASWH